MKKYSILLVAFLSVANVPSVLGWNQWASGLVQVLRNTHGYCSDLSTPKEREECYEFKRQYAEFWDEAVNAMEVVQTVEPIVTPGFRMLERSRSFIYPQFRSIKELIAALRPGNQSARIAEDVLAKVARYHAQGKPIDQSYRKDIMLIQKTEAGKKAWENRLR